MRPDAYADVLGVMAADRRPTSSKLSPLLWMERATTRNDLAAIAASAHRQRDIEGRAARLRAIASRSAPPPPAGNRARRRRR